VNRALAVELEFNKVQTLVSTQAQTRLGRSFLTREDALPSLAAAARSARLTQAFQQLTDEDGRLSFAGVDDAIEWLEPGAPAPTEPSHLLHLLNLARRIAAARARVTTGPAEIAELGDNLPDTSQLIAQVAPRLRRDGTIDDQASPELARLRRAIGRVRHDLVQQLEGIRRNHPDVATDAPPTLRRDRYCLPVRASARSQLPGLLLDTSGSGATAFVEPFGTVDLNNDLADAVARERDEVQRIVAEIAGRFLAIRDELRTAVQTLAELDAIQARVQFGRLISGHVVMPGEGSELLLRQARHPLLDERLQALRAEVFGDSERRDPSHRVVPLDFRLPPGVRTLVISGPNAGGKTVVLKTIGVMVLMCYHGIPLPADDGTQVPEFDEIWCHIGDEQDVAADLSTFSGAMTATARLLRLADRPTLVLYDELGAGTDPLEGAALGCALLEELTHRSCVSVATTHLAAIALSAGEADGMDNAAMEYDETEGRATYIMATGRPGRSRALEIAARSGIPRSILDRASALLGGQHLELDRWLGRLEALEQELVADREECARQQRRLNESQREVDLQHEQLRQERERLPRELAHERDLLRRRAQRRLDEALARLDDLISRRENVGKRQRQRIRAEALVFEEPSSDASDENPAEFEPGAGVRVVSMGRSGILSTIRGSHAQVMVDGKRLWVPAADLAPDDRVEPPPPSATVEVTGEEPSGVELVLLGMDSERAREELERFLDQALASGRSQLRVVHGHGAGVLRRTVASVCRSHPAVRSFKHPPQHLGGTGVTEVILDFGE
jgi:DNA mismatch repair protein MutS2